MDVLEKEGGIYYHDCQNQKIENENLIILDSMSNVILTQHMAFFLKMFNTPTKFIYKKMIAYNVI